MAAGQSPLSQFEIKRWVPIEIGDVDVSLTNSAAFMVLTVVAIGVFLILGMRRPAIVPGRWQSMVELSYVFIANLVKDTVGTEGRPYFPFIFTVFMFVLVGNLIGMVPYGFTFTSHIIVTFTMAMVVFLGVTVIALIKHKIHFFTFFMPPGVPLIMAPLLVPIEIISYLSRPMSLSVRLFANMLAGHTLLKVFAGFVVALGLFGVFPLAFVVVLTGLEIVIAFLQAFVFTILTCLYLNDALHLH
ncbi:MAG TPA: F0F1 ATP synthase subunit A [Rhodospirillales bacterium]|nr:MAG: ATP synthase subunit a [Alphaproteobacteria bacterium MarineAlpha3_Bin3]HIM41430.1 F0F1 ATP synthase subunit A [Rhodospirillales bacterium]